jgi:hypothetical protein
MMLNASALGAGTLQFLIVALSCVQIAEASAYENDQHQYLQRRDIIEHQVHCCARSFVALIHVCLFDTAGIEPSSRQSFAGL